MTRRARRRPDRRRRDLRHRRRPSPRGALPGQELRDPRGARPTSAAPGTSSAIPGSAPTPTCTRSASASSRGPRRRRSPTAPRSSTTSARPRPSTGSTDKIRFDHRVVSAAWSSAGRALDGRGRARPTRGRRSSLTCGFLFMCSGYYRYDEGYTPEFPGIERLRRPGHPPAALARGPRLRRQAGRRDRQRRDRRDAGPGDGRDRRPRDDAAALADLRRLAARRRPDRQPPAPLPAGQGRLRDRPLEERPPADGASTGSAAGGRSWSSRLLRKGVDKALPPGYDVDTPLQPEVRPLGPAHVPGPRRRPLQGDLRAAAPRSSPTGSRPSPRSGIELESGERARGRHRRSPRPGSTCSSSAASSSAVDGERGRPLRDDDLQGDDAQRRPEHRLRARLHQRLLDAEGRPDLRVRLPPAQPHGRARLRPVRAPRSATVGHSDEPLVDLTSGYVLRSLDQLPKQGSEEPWKLQPELRRSTSAPCATARSTTAPWSSPARPRPHRRPAAA